MAMHQLKPDKLERGLYVVVSFAIIGCAFGLSALLATIALLMKFESCLPNFLLFGAAAIIALVGVYVEKWRREN